MTRRGLWVTWVAVLAAACTRSPRPVVEQLRLESHRGLEVIGATPESVVAQFRKRLEQQRFQLVDARPPDAAGSTWRVVLSVHLMEPAPDAAAVGRAAAVASWQQRGGDGAFDTEAHEQVEAASNGVQDIEAASGQALAQVLSRVAGEARALIEWNAAPDDKVIAGLTSDDASVRDAAVVVLARRQNPAALAPLSARLASSDLSVVRRTIGLLVELRDRRAVPALIDVAQGRDAVVQREVVFAVAALGGDEATAYLWSVAQGHDDAVVRASAEHALEELNSRGKR